MFKVNQLQVHAGDKQPNLEHAVYEDVLGDLLTSPLLKEMTQAMEWKVFSSYNVVQVGRVRAQMREREMIEQREKEQRFSTQSEPARDGQLIQMDGGATESQERETERQKGKRRQNRSQEEKKREREDMMRQQQRMVQMKNEQMKNDTIAWEQKNGEKRLEGRDQEGREYAMDEQQHASPSFSQTMPLNSPAPTPRRRQAVTPKSTPSRVQKNTLKSSVKKTPSKSKNKKSALHNITIESVRKHLDALDNGGTSHDMPEASSGAEGQGVGPMAEMVANNDRFAMSFEVPSGFAPMELPTFDEMAAWPFEQENGYMPVEIPAFGDMAGASFAQQQGNVLMPMEIPAFDGTAGASFASFDQGNGFMPMEIPAFDGTAGAAFAQPQQHFEGFGDGIFGGLEELFPGAGIRDGEGEFAEFS